MARSNLAVSNVVQLRPKETKRPIYEKGGFYLRPNPQGKWDMCWTERVGDRDITKRRSTKTSDLEEAKGVVDRYVAGQTSAAGAPVAEPTVGDIIDAYVADLRGRNRVSAVSAEYAAKRLREPLGRLMPSDLTMAVVRDWITAERTAGTSNSYLHKMVVSLIRPALKLAHRNRQITGDIPYVEAPPAGPPNERWLEMSQIDRFTCAARSDHIFLYLVLCYYTAARRGAILGLTWDRVDFQRRRIDFREPGRELVAKRRTVVPMSDVLTMALMMAYPQRQTDHVIEDCGAPIQSVKTGLRRAWRDAFADDWDWCGDDDEPLPMPKQILRHSAATHMAQKGIAIDSIADFLGDRVDTVWRVYRKHQPDWLAGAVSALGHP